MHLLGFIMKYSIVLPFLFFNFLSFPEKNSLTKSEKTNPDSVTVNFRSVGGIADGIFDNSSVLLDLLSKIGDTKTVIIFDESENEYCFKSTVVFKNKQNVTLLGTGKVKPKIKFTDGKSIGFRIESCSDFVIENIHFIGAGVKLMGANASPVKVAFSKKVVIRNCIVENGITNGIEGFLSDSCIISGNTVFGTKNYNGIGWAGGNYNLFTKNYCYDNRGQGMELRSLHFSRIEENVCTNNGEEGEQSSGITVECEDGSFPVKPLSEQNNSDFFSSVFSGYKENDVFKVKLGSDKPSEYLVFKTEKSDDSTMIYRYQSGPKNKLGKIKSLPYKGATEELIDVGSANINVTGNIVSNNKGYGIYVVSSRRDKLNDIIVKNNIITNNDLSGIFVTTASDNRNLKFTKRIEIENNLITGNGWKKNKWFIWLYFADSVTVKNNINRNNDRDNKIGLTGVINSDISVP